MPGPGQVDVKGQSPLSVLLYNFEVGSNTVKSEHMRALLQKVVPLLDGGGSVTIVGMASYTGHEKVNVDLSKRRAQATLNTLSRTVADTGKSAKVKVGVSRGWANAAASGEKYGTEDSRFRSVLVTAWLLPDPPPAPPDLSNMVPLPDMPPTLGDAFDKLSVGEAGVSTAFSIAELFTGAAFVSVATTVVMPILDSIFTILSLPIAWIAAGKLAHFNGWVRGFTDSMQEMAQTYQDPKLDPAKSDTWPALPHPVPHFEWNVPDSQLTADQQEDRGGRREGCDKAFEAIQGLDANPKDVSAQVNGKEVKFKMTGKALLWTLWQTTKGRVGAKFLEQINKKLREQGKKSGPSSSLCRHQVPPLTSLEMRPPPHKRAARKPPLSSPYGARHSRSVLTNQTSRRAIRSRRWTSQSRASTLVKRPKGIVLLAAAFMCPPPPGYEGPRNP